MPYKDKLYNLEYQREWRRKRREKLSLLKDLPCADCGGSYPYYVMEYDHGDQTKVGGISNMAIKNNWEVVLAEIDKCDLVCSNCHRIRTHKRLDHIPKMWRK